MALPVEQPRARMSIDGVPVGGLVALEVAPAGCFMAGRFRVPCALGGRVGYFAALGKEAVIIEVSCGWAWLCDAADRPGG